MQNNRDAIILWEAHRGGGGGYELPESCMFSFEYGWLLGGRPEADVRTTADGVLVSIHDPTLDRIARVLPEEFRGKQVENLTWSDLQKIEIGWDDYPGQHAPSLAMLFGRLREFPQRHMILDYKNADLHELAALIRRFDVARQLTFASSRRELLREVKTLLPEIRTKNWIGGKPEEIAAKFETVSKENFAGITEVQLHLNDLEKTVPGKWRYQLTPDFITTALKRTGESGVLLQVLPLHFEWEDLFAILELGVRSFAVDYPDKFTKGCAQYFSRNWGQETAATGTKKNRGTV